MWSVDAQTSFETTMKDGGNYILETDPSAFAIRDVLSQVQDGKERVLTFGSRCLSQA